MQPKRVLRERKCNIRERAIGAGRRGVGTVPRPFPLRDRSERHVRYCPVFGAILRTLIERSFSRVAFASDTYFCRDELSVGGKYPRV